MASAIVPFPVLDTFPGDAMHKPFALGVAMALAALVGAGHACSGQLFTGKPWAAHPGPGQPSRARNFRCRCGDTAHYQAGAR
jgi:hypothetical protein